MKVENKTKVANKSSFCDKKMFCFIVWKLILSQNVKTKVVLADIQIWDFSIFVINSRSFYFTIFAIFHYLLPYFTFLIVIYYFYLYFTFFIIFCYLLLYFTFFIIFNYLLPYLMIFSYITILFRLPFWHLLNGMRITWSRMVTELLFRVHKMT